MFIGIRIRTLPCVLVALGALWIARPAAATEGLTVDRTVDRIDFDGNARVDGDRLREAIVNTEDQLYQPEELENDGLRIERLYQKLGFFKARVTSVQARTCNGDRVCLFYRIEENSPALVTKVNVGMPRSEARSAPESVSPDALIAEVRPRIGQRFNHDQYLGSKDRITRTLRMEGYPFPLLTGEAIYSPETNETSLLFKVDPGIRAKQGRFQLEGVDRVTRDDVARLLPSPSDELYSPEAAEDFSRALQGLDVFSSVTTKETLVGDRVDTTFHVAERPLRRLRFGIGFRIENSRQDFRFRAQWSHRNFRGGLRRLDVVAEPRYSFLPSLWRLEQSGASGILETSLFQPGFLHRRQIGSITLGLTSDLEEGYRWLGPHAGVQLTRVLSRRANLSLGYQFRYFALFDVPTDFVPSATAPVPPELLFARNYRLGFLHQRIEWDDRAWTVRDNQFEPGNGIYLVMPVDESFPVLGSSFTYLRLFPEARAYLMTSRRSVLAFRAAYGRLIALAGRDGSESGVNASPITERFYGGGDMWARGFYYHRLSPQVALQDGRSIPVGGETTLQLSVEQRIWLTRLSGRWLIGTLFFDAGDVAQGARLSFPLHYSFGPGIRYDSPLGVVRLDAGMRLNRLQELDPGRQFAFHFTLGEAF